jgi:hypothetical protein
MASTSLNLALRKRKATEDIKPRSPERARSAKTYVGELQRTLDFNGFEPVSDTNEHFNAHGHSTGIESRPQNPQAQVNDLRATTTDNAFQHSAALTPVSPFADHCNSVEAEPEGDTRSHNLPAREAVFRALTDQQVHDEFATSPRRPLSPLLKQLRDLHLEEAENKSEDAAGPDMWERSGQQAKGLGKGGSATTRGTGPTC